MYLYRGWRGKVKYFVNLNLCFLGIHFTGISLDKCWQYRMNSWSTTQYILNNLCPNTKPDPWALSKANMHPMFLAVFSWFNMVVSPCCVQFKLEWERLNLWTIKMPWRNEKSNHIHNFYILLHKLLTPYAHTTLISTFTVTWDEYLINKCSSLTNFDQALHPPPLRMTKRHQR